MSYSLEEAFLQVRRLVWHSGDGRTVQVQCKSVRVSCRGDLTQKIHTASADAEIAGRLYFEFWSHGALFT